VPAIVTDRPRHLASAGFVLAADRGLGYCDGAFDGDVVAVPDEPSEDICSLTSSCPVEQATDIDITMTTMENAVAKLWRRSHGTGRPASHRCHHRTTASPFVRASILDT